MASQKEEGAEAEDLELLSQQLQSLDVSETTTEGKARWCIYLSTYLIFINLSNLQVYKLLHMLVQSFDPKRSYSSKYSTCRHTLHTIQL